MKVLITGCCGFIGFSFSQYLLNKNKKIKIVGVDSLNNYYSTKLKKDRLTILKKQKKRFKFLKQNLKNKYKLRKIFLDNNFDQVFHFAIEWNFAGMPAGADDRFFYGADQQPLGQLGSQLDLREVTGIGLVDRWLGIDVGLTCNRPTNFWTFPIASVSQSEGGFEAVHQSVVVMPHWLIQGDSQGQWGVTMRLSMQTTAEHTPATEGEAATLIR